MKKAQEFLYYNAINYSLSNSPLDRVCYIRPLLKRVTLGFLFGRQLEDPNHLLHGIGKRSRYVMVRTQQDAKNSSLKDLVKSAWRDAASSIAAMKQSMRERRADLRRTKASHQRTPRKHGSRNWKR